MFLFKRVRCEACPFFYNSTESMNSRKSVFPSHLRSFSGFQRTLVPKCLVNVVKNCLSSVQPIILSIVSFGISGRWLISREAHVWRTVCVVMIFLIPCVWCECEKRLQSFHLILHCRGLELCRICFLISFLYLDYKNPHHCQAFSRMPSSIASFLPLCMSYIKYTISKLKVVTLYFLYI